MAASRYPRPMLQKWCGDLSRKKGNSFLPHLCVKYQNRIIRKVPWLQDFTEQFNQTVTKFQLVLEFCLLMLRKMNYTSVCSRIHFSLQSGSYSSAINPFPERSQSDPRERWGAIINVGLANGHHHQIRRSCCYYGSVRIEDTDLFCWYPLISRLSSEAKTSKTLSHGSSLSLSKCRPVTWSEKKCRLQLFSDFFSPGGEGASSLACSYPCFGFSHRIGEM